MATFDYDTFLRLAGKGNVFDAVGTTFGVPSCLMNLGADVMKLLPSSVLGGMAAKQQAGRDAANNVITEIMTKLRLDLGLIEFDTEEGIFKFKHDSSKGGMDGDGDSLLGGVGNFFGAALQVAAAGGQLYNNYTSGKAQIDGWVNCVKGYRDHLIFEAGTAAAAKEGQFSSPPASSAELDEQFQANYANQIVQIKGADNFIDLVDKRLAELDSVLLDRARDPSKEPCITKKVADSFKKKEIDLKDYGFCVETAEIPKDKEEIIRLVFGPPKSKDGQFLLSVDGLYYDSQTSGLHFVLEEIASRHDAASGTGSEEDWGKYRERWKFEHDPNLGGKGTPVSDRNIVE